MENKKTSDKNDKRYKKVKSEESTTKFYVSIFILTFILSLFFSYISSKSINGLPILVAILMLLLVIFIGVLFDLIGVAVTVAKEEGFHAKASKKLKGSKTAISLIRNSHKVSSFCADVIGDVAGVLSGAISALIAIKITESYGLSFDLQFLISAFVASLTVVGKALGKLIARKKASEIVALVSKVIHIFKK